MAINNRSSTVMTARDTSPPTLTNPTLSRSVMKKAIDFVNAVNGDSAGSIYRILQIPSNGRVDVLKVICDALGTSAAVNIGVYYGNDYYANRALAGTVINASLFASALSVASAVAPTDITNQAGNIPTASRIMPLWQMAGLAADPECHLDICATVSVAIAATGNLALDMAYVE